MYRSIWKQLHLSVSKTFKGQTRSSQPDYGLEEAEIMARYTAALGRENGTHFQDDQTQDYISHFYLPLIYNLNR